MCNENIFQLIIEEELEGSRIDIALSLTFQDKSRNFFQKLLETGAIQVNGQISTSKKYKVKKGDILHVVLPVPKQLNIEAENIPIEVIYEDDDLLVVNKPKGMVVHPANGNETGTLVNAIMYHCGESLSSINGVIRPGIVHRIDKNTSGLLMVAKNDKAHNCLAEQLAEHSITRAYRAIVYNNFLEDEGTVNKPIGRDSKDRLKQAVTDLNSKRAVTHYKVLERFGKFTLIEARLETGRTHQIRVHMAYIKHPLLGDLVYGPKKKMLGAETQVLHAKILGFKHPRTGEYMEFESPLPEEFETILAKLRKE
jgi:23S rRNA pseudouridine1911/1915/1917 synthase